MLISVLTSQFYFEDILRKDWNVSNRVVFALI